MDEAEPADMIRGHRPLSLATDYNYQRDEDRDPPVFVALVTTVQDQLRVDSTMAPGVAAPPTRAAEVAATGRVAAAPIRVRIELPEVTAPAVALLPGESPPVDDAPEDAITDDGRINVNRAPAADLQSVSGIGPALADRIVAYRTAIGLFRSADDLQNVRGVGLRSIERIGPQLTVGDWRVAYRIAAGGGRSAESEAVPSGPMVNLNTASAEELDTLPGIGPAPAGWIIAYREAFGAFRSVEEVLEVRGVGPRVLEGFIDRVTVE